MINETAFPTNTESWEPTSGMTLRDYFAAAALSSAYKYCMKDYYHPESIAELAYEIADALLKARLNHETT